MIDALTQIIAYDDALNEREEVATCNDYSEIVAIARNSVSLDNLMEAAMCLWEAALYLTPRDDGNEPIQAWLDQRGTAEVRRMILNQAEACHVEWEQAVEAGYDDCFDWHWCPKWLLERIDWSDPDVQGDISLKPL